MLWFVLLLSPLASAIMAPISYNPSVVGGFYPNEIVPQRSAAIPLAYPSYYARPQFYGQQFADGSMYRGADNGYRRNGYGLDAMEKEIVKDVGAKVNRDSDERIGQQLVARGGEGEDGYRRDAAGVNYNRAGNSASGGAQRYDAADQDGYGNSGSDGHKKGHRTTGFHKSYHNVESGKDTKFVDEDHDVANANFGQVHDSASGDKEWGVSGRGHDEGSYGGRVAEDERARDGLRAVGAYKTNYGAHDANGYNHNKDLVYRRRQNLADDSRGQAGRFGHYKGQETANGDLW